MASNQKDSNDSLSKRQQVSQLFVNYDNYFGRISKKKLQMELSRSLKQEPRREQQFRRLSIGS